MKKYYLYILSDKNKSIFHFDITDDLTKCCEETCIKKNSIQKTYTKNMKLVYYEKAGHVLQAINLKKGFEKWENFWIKILIDQCNPEWNDLREEFMAAEIFQRR